jgi:hypothetical protein
MRQATQDNRSYFPRAGDGPRRLPHIRLLRRAIRQASKEQANVADTHRPQHARTIRKLFDAFSALGYSVVLYPRAHVYLELNRERI